jgi:hypothetical protein
MLPGQGPRPNTNDSSGKRVLRELQNRSLMQRPMTPRAETWIRCSRLHARENEKQVASKPEAAPMEIRTGDLGTGNRDESQLSWTDEKRRVETELVCLHAGQEAADHRTKRAETRGNEKRTQALERPRRKENQRQKRRGLSPGATQTETKIKTSVGGRNLHTGTASSPLWRAEPIPQIWRTLDGNQNPTKTGSGLSARKQSQITKTQIEQGRRKQNRSFGDFCRGSKPATKSKW